MPSAARVYDYLLGGGDNYGADRVFAGALVQAFPGVGAVAVDNRAFLRRGVRFLVEEAGIRQIIDIGCGFPDRAGLEF